MNLAVTTERQFVVPVVDLLSAQYRFWAKRFGDSSLHREEVQQFGNIKHHIRHHLAWYGLERKGMAQRADSLLDHSDPAFDEWLVLIRSSQVNIGCIENISE